MMRFREGVLYMSAHISKNAELFFRALGDIWVAEQTWYGNPNIAAWICAQAAEKTMKGLLRCFNIDYDYGHKLITLLEEVEAVYNVTAETKKFIMYLDDYDLRLRYKDMPNDPTPEDAKIAISRAKHIMEEFGANPKISKFLEEAKEVHDKVIRASNEKYSKIT